ncbi:hypothetical protein Bbelb_056300 [Branchiostoma belcheri]|nr:hypothetical protein Bbelb_056300 [Branchiostoma belcheri]
MAVAGKVKTLWSVFVCLIFLVLYVNWAGPVWDQLDMPIATPLQKQPRNSSDAVFGRSRRFLTAAAENLSSLTSEHAAMQRNGTSLSYRDSCIKPVTNFVFIKGGVVDALIDGLLHSALVPTWFTVEDLKVDAGFSIDSTEIYKTNCTRWPLFGDHFNFLVHHTVFNKTAMDRVMKPGTKYIGIMREPRVISVHSSSTVERLSDTG